MSIFPDRYEQPVFAILSGAVLAGILVLTIVFTVNQIRSGLAFNGSKEGNQISVDGTGSVTVTPDIGTLYVDVETKGDTSEEAKTENAKISNELVDKFKLAGVADADIKTASVSVYENQVYDNNTGQYDVDGWIAYQSITLTIRDTERAELLLDLATEGGATRTYGPNFHVDDSAPYLAQAREKAVEDAKAKAQVIADALDLKVGKVIAYYEYEAGKGYPYEMSTNYAPDAAMGGEIKTMELEEGSQEIMMNVTITYELK
jgi:uncharacterized protein YggE